jgi:hypothetical protein
MDDQTAKALRRFPRIATPRGIWVAWQTQTIKQTVCRVSDLNVGGLFIETNAPARLGDTVSVLLSVPEGEIRGHAIVRNVTKGVGMGVQFAAMGAVDTDRLYKLVNRLLQQQTPVDASS